MNQKQKQFKKNRLLQAIKYQSRSGTKIGCAKYWKGTSYEHWRVLSDIVFKLANEGYDVFTEVEFNLGGRADIVAINDEGAGYIIEVLHTENIKNMGDKLDKYPSEFEILVVPTEGFKLEEFKI